MTAGRRTLRRALVAVASVVLIAIAALWTFWGTAEMYHEGWFGRWTNRLPYLAPIAVTVLPALLCFRRPVWGGLLLIGVGVAVFGFFDNAFVSGVAVLVAATGLVFVWEGRARRSDGEPLRRRDVRTAALLGLTTVIFVGVSAANLPIVLTRRDDGIRTERRIRGNGVDLVWAPEGPGWNWRQPWGGYPSWQAIALYGVAPVGMGDKPGYGPGAGPDGATVYATAADMAATNLCLYLDEDGTGLRDEPQGIWRMPVVDEIARSLGRHGKSAGCEWAGETGEMVQCAVRPDKESPLWATDKAPIYYWAAEAADEDEAYFVAFNGTVNETRKNGGNPRHSHRCVRDP